MKPKMVPLQFYYYWKILVGSLSSWSNIFTKSILRYSHIIVNKRCFHELKLWIEVFLFRQVEVLCNAEVLVVTSMLIPCLPRSDSLQHEKVQNYIFVYPGFSRIFKYYYCLFMYIVFNINFELVEDLELILFLY